MPSRHSPLSLSSRLWFFVAVAILVALLAGAPVLRSAYSASHESVVARRSIGGATDKQTRRVKRSPTGISIFE